MLIASLSSAGISSTPPVWGKGDEKVAGDSEQNNSDIGDLESKLLDWTIELVDSKGNRASALLSHDSKLYPLIKGIPYRAKFLDSTKPEEVLFRRFEIPISAFQTVNAEFDSKAITEIKFVFDQSEKGAIILDSISID